MMDPRAAADDAADKIIDLLPMFLKTDRSREAISAIVLAAITRAVPAPSQGLGR